MLNLTNLLTQPLALLAEFDLSEWRMWHFWVLGAFVVAALEMVTPGFVLACLAFGCFAAAIVDLAGMESFLPQLWVCAGVTFASFFLIRPLMLRTTRGGQSNTGVDFLVGKETDITEKGEHDKVPLGKVNGEMWRLKSSDGQSLTVGDRVRVTGVDGNRLLVQKIPAPQSIDSTRS